MGAPFDALYDFDLSRADVDRYDLLFAVNAFYVDGAEIDRLRDLLEGSGTTVVWYYAPGNCRSGTWSDSPASGSPSCPIRAR